jgi:hypothetical protein
MHVMVTFSGITPNCQKESPISAALDESYMVRWTEERALYAEGIGHLDQYGSYIETLWSKGVVYFLRDYLFHDIEAQIERGVPARELRPLIARLNALNSDIQQYECSRGPTSASSTMPSPPTPRPA